MVIKYFKYIICGNADDGESHGATYGELVGQPKSWKIGNLASNKTNNNRNNTTHFYDFGGLWNQHKQGYANKNFVFVISNLYIVTEGSSIFTFLHIALYD